MITITGIRHQMTGNTLEEKTAKAVEYIKNIEIGTPLTLQLENDNAFDHDAIAVYSKRRRIGYVATEYCSVVRANMGTAVRTKVNVSRTDGHLTIWAVFELQDSLMLSENCTRRIAPKKCPVCDHPQAYFELQKTNY